LFVCFIGCAFFSEEEHLCGWKVPIFIWFLVTTSPAPTRERNNDNNNMKRKAQADFFFVDDEMTEGIDRRTHPAKLTDRHLESRARR
jgi:hypothetical protein